MLALAKNIVVLSLIIDGASQHEIWEIAYHLFLSDDAIQTLSSQCRKLHELTALDTFWDDSPYAFIWFATAVTLKEVRRHWDPDSAIYFSYQKRHGG